jgi:hypothetical protein
VYICHVKIRLQSDQIMQLLPSYEVNIQSCQSESGCFPEGCSPRETTNCENRNDPDLVQAFLKKWWVESDFKAPNLSSQPC